MNENYLKCHRWSVSRIVWNKNADQVKAKQFPNVIASQEQLAHTMGIRSCLQQSHKGAAWISEELFMLMQFLPGCLWFMV